MATAIHWFRRDFRVRDNTALFTAASEHDAVVGAFIVDPRWLGNPDKTGPHQTKFWLESLRELQTSLAKLNIPLIIRTDRNPVRALLAIARDVDATTITYNKEYEPDQIAMDERLEREAAPLGLKVNAYKDAAIFEEHEILTGSRTIYSVFSPYKRAYLARVNVEGELAFTVRGLPRKSSRMIKAKSDPLTIPHDDVSLDLPPGEAAGLERLEQFIADHVQHYRDQRDYPMLADHGGVSRLSAHLNAGTVSIRQAMHAAFQALTHASTKRPAQKAIDGSDPHTPRESTEHFISELIWREFYRMILFNFPHTVSKPFQDNYSHVTWANDPAHFKAWCEGRTGYPIVDAAMRQLAQTGWQHNRLRMIAAMFLTKDLDTSWVLGERFYMKSLMDYDQACNVGGWQWSASTGTDAAPYFRIMNPVLQSERYDPNGEFIRRYVPELRGVSKGFIHAPWLMPADVQKAANCVIGKDYPAPIVDHHEAKERAVAKFRKPVAA